MTKEELTIEMTKYINEYGIRALMQLVMNAVDSSNKPS